MTFLRHEKLSEVISGGHFFLYVATEQ